MVKQVVGNTSNALAHEFDQPLGDHSVSNSHVFGINRIYLKDLSLEQPNSPKIFLENSVPEVEIEVLTQNEIIAENIYECVLTGTIKASIDRQVLFLIEGKQAAVIEFEGQNILTEGIDAILNVDVPNLLLSYLRVNLADLISRAGFPPVHLGNIDFYGLYLSHRKDDSKRSNSF